MAKMAAEREQSIELSNLVRRPLAIVIGAALLLALAGVAAMYAFGEQTQAARYVRVVAGTVLLLVGCWTVFRGRTS
jgi:cytochrome c biogenesis protein CcdA